MAFTPTSLRVLLGITGSVASVKVPMLIDSLFHKASTQRIDLELKLIATSHALQFCSLQDDLLAFSQSTSRKIETYVDKDEYRQWKKLGDEVLHIQ
ncbi:hypothetical protein HMI55_007352, partial [Coelomomyces lativittatus]